jgi:excisionase family DNA binding protein
MTIDFHNIVSTPGTVGGKPRIDGTRISVPFIVDLYLRQHAGAEQIANDYEITPAQVYAALAYYYDHQAEIDALLAEEDRVESQMVDVQHQAEMRALADERVKAYRANNQEMTVTEVAEAFGVSTRAVRQAATNGWVSARKSGSTWLIRRSDAEARWAKPA